jgi:hypothetical protein
MTVIVVVVVVLVLVTVTAISIAKRSIQKKSTKCFVFYSYPSKRATVEHRFSLMRYRNGIV